MRTDSGHTGAQREPRVPCEALGPWDPNVGADTTLFTLGGFPFKHIFASSVFYVFFLQKNVHFKKLFFFSVSFKCFFNFPSVSFKYLLSSPSVSPEQDEKDLAEIPKLDTGKASVLRAYSAMQTKFSVCSDGRRRCVCATSTAMAAASQ